MEVLLSKINTNMIRWLSNIFITPTTDWSDIERLEQRIRDLRRRIREAKNSKKSVFSFQRTYNSTSTLPRNQSNDNSTSSREGPQVEEESRQNKREKQEIRRKEMKSLREKLKPKPDPIQEEMARQDRELAEAIEKAMAKQMNK